MTRQIITKNLHLLSFTFLEIEKKSSFLIGFFFSLTIDFILCSLVVKIRPLWFTLSQFLFRGEVQTRFKLVLVMEDDNFYIDYHHTVRSRLNYTANTHNKWWPSKIIIFVLYSPERKIDKRETVASCIPNLILAWEKSFRETVWKITHREKLDSARPAAVQIGSWWFWK